MSWLGDVKRAAVYCCKEGHETKIVMTSAELNESASKVMICESCSGPTYYKKFENIDASQGGYSANHTTIKSYEQNGRKAVKIGSTHISKTKLNYMETGKVEAQRTTGFMMAEKKAAAESMRKDVEGMSANIKKAAEKAIVANNKQN